jgi:hypothetical protein
MAPIPHRALITIFFYAASLSSAFAIMPPEVYEQARQTAEHHVQLRILDVSEPPADGYGDCVVRVRVIMTFRGDLPMGREFPIHVSCLRPDANPRPGGELWNAYAELAQAEYLEAFLSGDGTPDVDTEQVVIISGPANAPACDPAAPGIRCTPI